MLRFTHFVRETGERCIEKAVHVQTAELAPHSPSSPVGPRPLLVRRMQFIRSSDQFGATGLDSL